MNTITQNKLKSLLSYDKKTGVFQWKVGRSGVKRVSKIAGAISREGYVFIGIDYKIYQAHRLAFLFVEGYFPEYGVDHLDGNKSNNCWTNLRHATQSCNMQNKAINSNNKSGFPGVTYRKNSNKWTAQIVINGKTIHLGCYGTCLDAALARFTFEVQCPGWDCNHRSELTMAIKNEWQLFDAHRYV